MISNQSLRAPGLASFCFLTTSKSEKETIFLIVIIVARVGASLSLPTPGLGASVMPRLQLATAAGSSPASTNRSPPRPEARMRAWVRQGWSQDKNREAELRSLVCCIGGGEGAARGWGAGALRERERDHRVTGATEAVRVSVRWAPGQNGYDTEDTGYSPGDQTVLTRDTLWWTLDRIHRRQETQQWDERLGCRKMTLSFMMEAGNIYMNDNSSKCSSFLIFVQSKIYQI